MPTGRFATDNRRAGKYDYLNLWQLTKR